MPTFDTPGPVRLDLRLPAGEVEIVTSARPTTDVELQPLRDDDATREALATARIELQDLGWQRTVVVDVPSKRGFFGRQPQFRLHVRAPEGADVTCRTRSADVDADGVYGNVDLKTASGDASFDVVNGTCAINSASGDVRVGVARGGLDGNTASGDIVAGRAEAGATLNAVSGDVTIQEAIGAVAVHTVSGDQRLEAVSAGPVEAHSVSGDIWIGVAQGQRVYINASAVSGDTSSDLAMTDAPAADAGPVMQVQANAVSGDIHIARAHALEPNSPR